MKRAPEKKRTWALLIGSKRKLTEILTGQVLPKNPDERLADDILPGAKAIADFTGLKERTIYHKADALQLKRLGGADGQ
jgi:hypothetical protein